MSEIIVLDTHIWLWLINGNFDRFPAHWRDLLESAERVGISPVSWYSLPTVRLEIYRNHLGINPQAN